MAFTNIQMNFAPGQHTRFESLHGREYLVAPMVMLTVGVHNGSGGAVLYTEEELSKTPEVWNTKPLVVYHPVEDGVGISACTPNVLEAQGVGMIMNTRWDGKLRAEAWFDIEKTKQVDNRIIEALEQGTMLEVSTGLFTDNEEVEGTFTVTGEAYTAIAHNFRPDHLAILPDRKGACSIADGAGLLQTNALSHSDTERRIRDALVARYNDSAWVVDVFDNWFVFATGGRLYRMSFTKGTNDTVTIPEGFAEPVVPQTVYRLVDGTLIANSTHVPLFPNLMENESMTKTPAATKPKLTKKALVDGLIANTVVPFGEADRAYLEGKDEPFLESLLPKEEVVPSDAVVPPVVPSVVANQGQQPLPYQPPVTVEAYIANAPAGVRDMLVHGMQSYGAERQRMVNTIVTNGKGVYSEAELQQMPHDALAKLSNLVAATTPAPQEPTQNMYAPSFAGAGVFPVFNQGGAIDDEPLDLPSM